MVHTREYTEPRRGICFASNKIRQIGSCHSEEKIKDTIEKTVTTPGRGRTTGGARHPTPTYDAEGFRVWFSPTRRPQPAPHPGCESRGAVRDGGETKEHQQLNPGKVQDSTVAPIGRLYCRGTRHQARSNILVLPMMHGASRLTEHRLPSSWIASSCRT